ncbi:MAG: DNA polymerase III subunit delta [Propioniciclava sp.]|uniref:DNA polymerase III subunit delta n=1 Tax=Propioniciclava sp. TaxID=2038686 RepID=UPI0039E58469
MDDQRIFGAVTLVSGPEALLAERAVERLVRQALDERPAASVTKVTGGELDAGRLAEVTGGSLFAEDSVVVITEVSDLAQPLFDAVLALVATPMEELALILVHPGGVKGKGLLDKLKKARVTIIDCPAVKAWEMPQFAAGEARRQGGRIDPPTAARLVEALGADVRAVAGAIRQLLMDSDDQVITEGSVRRYFAGRADVTSFTVADHVMAGRRNEALGALRWALDTGVAPVLVTSALAGALRGQGRYTDFAGSRMRDGDLARELGVPPFKVKEIVQRARSWTPRGLATALQAVAEADAAVKGQAADPAFALERMVITVTGLRGRRPDSGMGR